MRTISNNKTKVQVTEDPDRWVRGQKNRLRQGKIFQLTHNGKVFQEKKQLHSSALKDEPVTRTRIATADFADWVVAIKAYVHNETDGEAALEERKGVSA